MLVARVGSVISKRGNACGEREIPAAPAFSARCDHAVWQLVGAKSRLSKVRDPVAHELGTEVREVHRGWLVRLPLVVSHSDSDVRTHGSGVALLPKTFPSVQSREKGCAWPPKS